MIPNALKSDPDNPPILIGQDANRCDLHAIYLTEQKEYMAVLVDMDAIFPNVRNDQYTNLDAEEQVWRQVHDGQIENYSFQYAYAFKLNSFLHRNYVKYLNEWYEAFRPVSFTNLDTHVKVMRRFKHYEAQDGEEESLWETWRKVTIWKFQEEKAENHIINLGKMSRHSFLKYQKSGLTNRLQMYHIYNYPSVDGTIVRGMVLHLSKFNHEEQEMPITAKNRLELFHAMYRVHSNSWNEVYQYVPRHLLRYRKYVSFIEELSRMRY